MFLHDKNYTITIWHLALNSCSFRYQWHKDTMDTWFIAAIHILNRLLSYMRCRWNKISRVCLIKYFSTYALKVVAWLLNNNKSHRNHHCQCWTRAWQFSKSGQCENCFVLSQYRYKWFQSLQSSDRSGWTPGWCAHTFQWRSFLDITQKLSECVYRRLDPLSIWYPYLWPLVSISGLPQQWGHFGSVLSRHRPWDSAL